MPKLGISVQNFITFNFIDDPQDNLTEKQLQKVILNDISDEIFILRLSELE